MLVHVVLFRFKSDVAEATREEILAAARDVLPKIPGVSHLLVGKSIKKDAEFDHALSMYFEDEAALIAYRDHPGHVRFRDETFFPFLDDKMGLDYVE